MSDHDARTDPADLAAHQAEALLIDEEARAARRARVLAAVTRELEPVATIEPRPRRSVRPYAGWLAAAGVVGLSVVLATQLYPPPPRPPAVEPLSPPFASAVPETRSAQPPAAAPPAKTAASPILPAPRLEAETGAAIGPERKPPTIPAPPPLFIKPVAPDLAPAPPPPPLAAPAPPPPSPAIAASPTPEDLGAFGRARAERPGAQAAARFGLDPAGALRSAAAAGRTAEVEALLDRGAPVDASDAEGDTALMNSVRGRRSGVASLLLRYGASPDRKNHAGESARDMVEAAHDPKLDAVFGEVHRP